MRLWILCTITVLLAALGRAQERTASVVRTDGTQLSGRVVEIGLQTLQIAVDGKVVTIDTKDIRSCTFEAVGEAVNGSEPEHNGATTPREIGNTGGQRNAGGVVAREYRKSGGREGVTRAYDVRYNSLLGARLARLDATYPWLAPTSPHQWLSIGLLLFALLSLVVYGSVRVAGGEMVSFPRSMLLAVIALGAAFGQFVFLPCEGAMLTAALVGNVVWPLLVLKALFDLPGGTVFVAFGVQIGCVGVGWGVVQLVDYVLAVA